MGGTCATCSEAGDPDEVQNTDRSADRKHSRVPSNSVSYSEEIEDGGEDTVGQSKGKSIAERASMFGDTRSSQKKSTDTRSTSSSTSGTSTRKKGPSKVSAFAAKFEQNDEQSGYSKSMPVGSSARRKGGPKKKKSGDASAKSADIEAPKKKKEFKWTVKTTSTRNLEARQKVEARGERAVNSDDRLPSHSDLDDSRPSAESMSVSERMALYKKDMENVDDRHQARVEFHKKQRGVDAAKGAIDQDRKAFIQKAFAKRIVAAKTGKLGGPGDDSGSGSSRSKSMVMSDPWNSVTLAADRRSASVGSGVVLTDTTETRARVRSERRKRSKRGGSSRLSAGLLYGEGDSEDIVRVTDVPKSADHSSVVDGLSAMESDSKMDSTTDSSGGKPKKKKTMNEVLMSASDADAAAISEALGLFTTEDSKPKVKGTEDSTSVVKGSSSAVSVSDDPSKTHVLNMNNNDMLKKMTPEQRDKMQDLIAQSIIDTSRPTKIVKLCNANVDDRFLEKILDKLSSEAGMDPAVKVEELWLESNAIGDGGFTRLAEFIRTDRRIKVYKFERNKKGVSTKVCDLLVSALLENPVVLKFVFELRFTHQRDKLEKALRRNQEAARKARVAARKAREAA